MDFLMKTSSIWNKVCQFNCQMQKFVQNNAKHPVTNWFVRLLWTEHGVGTRVGCRPTLAFVDSVVLILKHVLYESPVAYRGGQCVQRRSNSNNSPNFGSGLLRCWFCVDSNSKVVVLVPFSCWFSAPTVTPWPSTLKFPKKKAMNRLKFRAKMIILCMYCIASAYLD